MINLEKLTLYLRIDCQTNFMDPIYLINQFLMNMSQLHSFNFYLGTRNKKTDLVDYLSKNDIKENYIKNIIYQEISNFVQNVYNTGIYHIFTLPFQFDNLTYVGNIFPNILYKNVIELLIYDDITFEHEFFQRISQHFPRLRKLNVINSTPSLCDTKVASDDIIQSYEIVEYPHLTFLDISRVNIYYVEEFLNETKIRLPCLTKLRIDYEKLRMITKDFIRETTRRNCANVKQLIINTTIVGSKDYYDYFPLL